LFTSSLHSQATLLLSGCVLNRKYRLGGRDNYSNFAKAEDISGTANEENQRSCMSKKEGTHAKRRINALHISILVQPDDYRWLENSSENLHILVKDSE
jgi:hypothetical protein